MELKIILPSLKLNLEKWKWNEECQYYVSNQGHFKDAEKHPAPIKINNGGYVVLLSPNGWISAHRLVMKTWKPTLDMDNLTIDHIDHNKRNNNVANLEWVTREENLKRAEKDFISKDFKEIVQKDTKLEMTISFHSPNDAYTFMKRAAGLSNIDRGQFRSSLTKAINGNKKYINAEWKISK